MKCEVRSVEVEKKHSVLFSRDISPNILYKCHYKLELQACCSVVYVRIYQQGAESLSTTTSLEPELVASL